MKKSSYVKLIGIYMGYIAIVGTGISLAMRVLITLLSKVYSDDVLSRSYDDTDGQ